MNRKTNKLIPHPVEQPKPILAILDFNLLPEDVQETIINHPLFNVFITAIYQAAFGKGERHGGAAIDFNEQPWKHYAAMHGRGFLTGQAAKKLEEAASVLNGEPFINEVLGAIVYCGMPVLDEKVVF